MASTNAETRGVSDRFRILLIGIRAVGVARTDRRIEYGIGYGDRLSAAVGTVASGQIDAGGPGPDRRFHGCSTGFVVNTA